MSLVMLNRGILRAGRVVSRVPAPTRLYGWPCLLTVQLDDGQLGYVLDFSRWTEAPPELRCRMRPELMAGCRVGTPVRVQVRSIFARLFVLRIELAEGPRSISAAPVPRPCEPDLGVCA